MNGLVESYLAWAEAEENAGNPERAAEILEEGLEATGSESLEARLEELGAEDAAEQVGTYVLAQEGFSGHIMKDGSSSLVSDYYGHCYYQFQQDDGFEMGRA